MKISILTPTYNRANFLKQLYDSIIENVEQNVKIEWLIMDDGSTDRTRKIVEDFTKQNKIEIKYYYQENQGKMVAINQLVKEATGDMIVDCDSDDYFAKNAFTMIKEQWEKNKHRKDVYGICFLKYNTKGKNMGNEFKKSETTMFDLYFKEEETGEKAVVFFCEVRKKFQHELEKNERFITEARMYHKMDEHYKIIGVNQPIMICEYQEQGYTSNITKQFKENPYGYYEYFKEILQKDFKGIPFTKRLYVIKHYILFSYLTKQYQSKSIKNRMNKVLYYSLLLPGMIKSEKFITI
ncbi:MAG: glycosyltransferase family 2 protein [Clostridia bacterium]|nr:glycosyltransferase family 2 protein [Clostridia bacterium]